MTRSTPLAPPLAEQQADLPDGYRLREGADAKTAHAYLTRSYWAEGIPLDTVERALDNSFVMSVLYGEAQVGMVRLVTDYATFAYLADVYVLEAHRGQGLSKAMLAWLHGHPELQGLRRWALFTQDAQGLYRQFGWSEYPHPTRMMTRDDPDIYRPEIPR